MLFDSVPSATGVLPRLNVQRTHDILARVHVHMMSVHVFGQYWQVKINVSRKKEELCSGQPSNGRAIHVIRHQVDGAAAAVKTPHNVPPVMRWISLPTKTPSSPVVPHIHGSALWTLEVERLADRSLHLLSYQWFKDRFMSLFAQGSAGR